MKEYNGAAPNGLDEAELLEIRCFPDPVLKKPAEPVEAFDEALLDLVERMRAAMRAREGVGLAAPQVDRKSTRLNSSHGS